MSEWLAKWKFRTWTEHSSTGQPVSDGEKQDRAREIAAQLCNHSLWLTHGKAIKLDDLLKMRLNVTDYSKDKELSDAIRRYYVLLRMGFEATTMYKLFETPTTNIYRFLGPAAPPVPPPALVGQPQVAQIDFVCPRCTHKTRLQANLGKKSRLQPGSTAFPADNKFKCPACGLEEDLGNLRKQLEAQSKQPVVN